MSDMTAALERLMRTRAAEVGMSTAILEMDEALGLLRERLGHEPAQQAFDEAVADARREIEAKAFDEGYAEGATDGREDGYRDGREDGYRDGHSDGVIVGRRRDPEGGL